MHKKAKIAIVLAITGVLFLYWLGLALTHTKYHMINYYWQAGLAAAAITFSIFGMLSAKHWSWLKSGVGQGVFFISLGLLMWGIGQAGWTYFVIKDPAQQTPPTHILDIIYSSSIPLWTYGMLKLSKATGARYGLRKWWAKLAVIGLILAMFVFSYYFLVVVARGGTSYFHQAFWNIFFDLGYAAGDAINLTLALAIFGLSWKYLGGRFKKPIITILFGFAMIYLADFVFSFYDGKGQYYNGHWDDLLYLAMAAIFGVGLCLLDPSSPVAVPAESSAGIPPTNQPEVAAVPAPMPPQPASPDLTQPVGTPPVAAPVVALPAEQPPAPVMPATNTSTPESPLPPTTSNTVEQPAANNEPWQTTQPVLPLASTPVVPVDPPTEPDQDPTAIVGGGN